MANILSRKNKIRFPKQSYDQPIDIRNFNKLPVEDAQSASTSNVQEASNIVAPQILLDEKQNNELNDQNNGEEFMNFFQVNGIVNGKYKNIDKENADKKMEHDMPKLNSENLVQNILLMKLSNQSEFIRHLGVFEQGRQLLRQVDISLETIKNLIDIATPTFKDKLNLLIYQQQNGMLKSE